MEREEHYHLNIRVAFHHQRSTLIRCATVTLLSVHAAWKQSYLATANRRQSARCFCCSSSRRASFSSFTNAKTSEYNSLSSRDIALIT